MTYSKIEITFVSDFLVGYELNIYNNFTVAAIGTIWTEKWVGIRTTSNKVTKGDATAIVGERAAINFINAFELDYNFPIQYEVTRIDNVVTIKSMVPDQQFVSGEVGYSGAPIGAATFIITNFVGVPYEITNISFTASPPIYKCSKVRVNVQTSNLTTKILAPFVLNGNTNNPFNFDYLRNISFLLKIQDALGNEIEVPVTTPALLNQANFVINQNYTPSGGTVEIIKSNSFGLNIEYSLDNITFQSEALFSGLAIGTYTLYVKDQFGCSFNFDFSVNEFEINNPEFYYSKSNSLRLAERVDFSLVPKNDENTLSCESLSNLNYQELQRFVNTDSVTVQFKSNYATNTASIIKEDQTVVNLPIIKNTDNIGNKNKRDAIIYPYSSTKSGVYFIGGNTYNFDTNSVNGTYLLNGLTPIWAIIGKFVVIDSIWYQIENVIYVENKNADVLIISKGTIGVDQSIIIGSIYNTQNYEVYETTINMFDFANQYFRFKLEVSDPNFVNRSFLSELINTAVTQENTVEIQYFNIDNNDVVYQTGIQHFLRIPFTKIGGYFSGDSESNKTDSSVVLLNANLYEGNEFIFEPITKELYRKLVISLNHKFVFINNEGFVVDGEPEVDGPLDDSNLYVVTSKMLKTGKSYNIQSVGEIPLIGTLDIEIPGMIEWDGGFIEQ